MQSNVATGLEKARFNMIEQQVRTWEVLDPEVLDVLRTVPREEFVPARYRKLAFADLRIPLGHDQVMMKPLEEGRVLQCLALGRNDRVLEIGTGSGFLTACLARMARSVTSLEVFGELAAQAREILSTHRFNNAEVIHTDALGDWSPDDTFDAVVVTGSVAEIPVRFRDWVADGGRLFMVRGHSPVMEAVCLTALGGGEWHTDSLFETDLPRLIHGEDVPTFEF